MREYHEPAIGLTVREYTHSRLPFMRFQIGLTKNESRTEHYPTVPIFHLRAWGATLEEATAKLKLRFIEQPKARL